MDGPDAVSHLVQGPNGQWYDPNIPTHCNEGHPLVARSHVHGWDGTRSFWWCLHPGHADDASRYRYSSGSQQPADWERGTPDHGVTRPERRQG